MGSTEPLLTVRDLSVSITVPAGILAAVRSVSFTLDRGETLGIVGESGCGKSMMSMAIMGLLPPHVAVRAETLRFEGMDLLGLPERRMADLRGDRMAMIFQEPMTALNPLLTIGEQLTETYRRHRTAGRREAREKALHLLDRVGIASPERRLGQYPHQLSGGLRQRVMIAMALMCDPDLIIADEPTTALDVTIQAQILALLAELQRESGAAMIFVSHDLGVISRVADKVSVMYAGSEVEGGSTAQVFGAPAHPYTQGLFRCLPNSGLVARGAPLGSIPGVVPSLIGQVSGCMFRPRCALARDACLEAIPTAVVGDGHRARCVAVAAASATATAPQLEVSAP
ncbi:ABC transporter ATP-binding protein [Caenispirillum bisanense]|uniref:ABC transporter ATP-binding protein n=1 Tax=Caenispirillum bisanense TaxID=414052 RepID=UPI0031D745D3